jgi:hypothetical protein
MANADAGNGKDVKTNITLTGTAAGNYTLTQPAGITVNIIPAGDAKTIFYWANEQDGVLYSTDGDSFTLSRGAGQSLTITADPEDTETYTNQRWFINATPQTAANGQASFTFNSAGRPNGTYRIDLMVQKGVANYSRFFTVTVTN